MTIRPQSVTPLYVCDGCAAKRRLSLYGFETAKTAPWNPCVFCGFLTFLKTDEAGKVSARLATETTDLTT